MVQVVGSHMGVRRCGCAQRLTASEDGAATHRQQRPNLAGCAQRLTASEDGAGSKAVHLTKNHLVLNALRHQRMVQLLASFQFC